MPSLNVRLTAEQHGELRAGAAKAGRSIQQEMIARLFSKDVPLDMRDPAQTYASQTKEKDEAPSQADLQAGDEEAAPRRVRRSAADSGS